MFALDAAMLALGTAVPLVASISTGVILGTPGVWEAARNYLGLLGLTGMSVLVLGPGASWVPAVGLVFLTMTAGVDDWNHPYAWAWLIQVWGDSTSWSIAMLLFLAGVAALGVLQANRWPRRSART
jgi:hypothetical protein